MKAFTIGAATAIFLALGGVTQAQDKPRGYLIANYDIKDQAVFQKYLDAAGPIGPKYNIKIIIFNVKSTGLEGAPKSVTAVAEFPSLADVQQFYNSPEYTEAKKLRVASTEGSVIMTEGFAPAK